jgi:stearoyl-CoA 9-desaturase NADPH oxidoreductase
MEPGTIVGLNRPEGGFVLPEPPPSRVLFLTARSGITPVRAMLHDILAGGAGGGEGGFCGGSSSRVRIVPGVRLG